jgi:large subunit ribosomal protein L29
MKAKELNGKSQNELKKLLTDVREKLRMLRFDLSAGKLKNFREIRGQKKEIARILTVLRQKKEKKIEKKIEK